MPTLLRIDSSADLANSTSRALTGLFVDTWSARDGERAVIDRDLHAAPPPHLVDPGLHYAPRLRIDSEQPPTESETVQDELIGEILAADALVIGAPMYNWSIPSTLKAWIDHIHVLGVTAPFDTPEQPFAGIPVVLISSRGLTYGPGTPDEEDDHTIPPICRVLETALGMPTTVVTADLTLANRLAPLASLAAESEKSLERARAEVVDLASSVGP
ncbi:FMN-dependent NADH-azoreductase [Gordonia soli]|uniref:FMN dependent NADH:quinone oxidoreductase n=1 Tax=Gordonia soli NBRC 108243 TaxID=1223545 RepID=M0QQI2_9ACTN|nr:NAD(P)H-dependent oxidoreductase [Gordonia soli]GAC69707.1 FMN-dependent NADH-azoreductase [Gordonia soli NBRC 108243]